MKIGKSIKLFLVDGTVGGLRTAEIMNWTGHILAAQRSDLGELLKREEAGRTGAYILLGDDQAYIGEGDVVKERLKTHNKAENNGGKDFWTDVLIITSKDTNLTKAHARYLESRLIALAKAAGRMTLLNGTNPDPIALPEADVSDMEYYISQVQIVLPALGVNLLRGNAQANQADSAEVAVSLSPVFVMQIPWQGGEARAQEIDGEFTVLEGSNARLNWGSQKLKRNTHSKRDLRNSLIDKGVLTEQDGKLVFTQNQVFSSPSAAAAVVVGTETHNGRLAWHVEGSQTTYGAWQEQLVSEEYLDSGTVSGQAE